ncbi:MAG: fimbrillin family protein [Bacteroidales bacterium]|nr:fimbrillin family protein [Bacteroidales bacterium]MCI2121997.1 fimbrillin family protein [Bacteroidales bacterium]MCI2145582.1 fimbrillin family protein [Bacteroidales bacterium]
MKTRFKNIGLLVPTMLLMAAMTVPVSCVRDETGNDFGGQDEIGFKTAISEDNWTPVTKSGYIPTDSSDSLLIREDVTVNQPVVTKGSMVDAISTYGSFGTFAYVYASTSNWSSAKSGLTPNFMYNLKSEDIGGEWRPSDGTYYWPAATYKVSFFGYAPYVDYMVGGTDPVSDHMQISGATATGAPVIDYTVPAKIADQIDLMTADSIDVPGNYHQAVPMTFRHVLSGVRFNAKTQGLDITIKKVTISNVYDHGTLAIDENAWDLYGTKSDYTFPTDLSVDGTSVAVNDPTDSLFFMLPQTLPSGSTLSVTYVMNGIENTATADFSGKVWEMGKIYIYNLTIDANVIYYTFTITQVSAPGDNSDNAVYKVVSTRTTDYGNGNPIVENVPYSINGLPSGVTYTKNNDSTLTITAAARTGIDSTIICGSSYAMRTLDSLTGPIDLTTGAVYNGNRGETANCYVINQAGYYCFPVDVMGNGDDGIIYSDDNKINENGYFINYEGNSLTTNSGSGQRASISPNGCEAVLLWEDAKGLIQDLTLDGDYVRFKTMPKDEMTPGNAVIALRTQGGNSIIKWSWHIWCTLPTGSHPYTDPMTGRDSTLTVEGVSMHDDQGTAFSTARYSEGPVTWYDRWGLPHTSYDTIATPYATKIMSVNLGSVERNRKFICYPSRSFGFTAVQNVTGNSADGTYSQNETDVDIIPAGTTNTLYQWGRKDPFISGNISTYVSDNTSLYYNSKHEGGTNTFTLEGSSDSNESDGVFGTYSVQDNSYIPDGGDMDSKYPTNLKFAIRHPMTFIYNTHQLNYNYSWNNYSDMTTPVDWFTYHIDVVSDYDDVDIRYDNALLWGAGYHEHKYQFSSVKTIYDPSPAGYKVPVGYCYGSSFFYLTGVFDYGNYTNVGFFPATGTRDSKTGKLHNMGVRGDFWASSLRFVYQGMDTACGIVNANGEFGHSYEQDTFNRGEALSVRPVGEDY